MADREIRLIGSFQDDITPKLRALNQQLNGVLRTFQKFQSQLRPISREMGVLSMASQRFADSLKAQRSAMESTISAMRQYRREMGVLNRGNRAFSDGIRTQNNSMASSIRAMNGYRTAVGRVIAAQKRMKGVTLPPPVSVVPKPPRGGGGGRISVPPGGGGGEGGGYGGRRRVMPVSGGGGDGGGGGYRGVGAGVFGVTLGSQLGGVVTNAIVAGFQLGANILIKPFQWGAGRIAERIDDEMSDIRAAGGLFSIARGMKDPKMLSTFSEAETYVKDQNRYLAKLAGTLPGDTQEYIAVAKQISDGIFQAIATDRTGTQKLALELAQKRGATPQEIAKLQGASTPAAMQQTGKELVGDMTKLTVLAGLGGQRGPYGLPMLIERMISEDQVSMGMFQRYAAIFRDPMIRTALEKNIAKINASAKNTGERIRMLKDTMESIVTPELVRRYQRSVGGIMEALKTALISPEVGLLGIGRPLGEAVVKYDDFGRALGEVNGKMVPLTNLVMRNGVLQGQVIDAQGRVTNQFVKVATEQISLFDKFRDMFSNVVIALLPILDNFVLLFDPLLNLSNVLTNFRTATMAFQNSFERYREAFLAIADDISDKNAREVFKASIPFRASMQAVNNAMLNYGGYGKDLIAARDQFDKFSAIITKPESSMEQLGAVLRQIIEKFLSSDFAKKIGMAVGTIVGTIVSEVGNMMKEAAGLATSSKLAQGFGEGFRAAGGPEGVASVIKSVFHLFGKLLIETIKAAPLESAIAAFIFLLPAALSSLLATFAEGAGAALFGAGGRGGRRGGRGGRIPAAILGTLGGPATRGGGRRGGAMVPLSQLSRSTGRHAGISSPAFRAIPSRIPAFPQVALPGKDTGIGGLSGPFVAPSLPKKPIPAPTVGPLAKLFQNVKGKGMGMLAAGAVALSTKAPQLMKAGQALTNIGKRLPVVSAGFAAADFGFRVADGQGVGAAAAGAGGSLAGGLIGGAIGTMIAPGIGTAIGGVIGSVIGDSLTSAALMAFSEPSQAQREAANAQKIAAQAAVTKNNIAGVDTQFNLGTAAQLQSRLQALGLYTPPTTSDLAAKNFGGGGAAASFLQAYTSRNIALEQAKQAAATLAAKEGLLKDILPPDVVEKNLKPLRDKATQTATFAEAQERAVAAAFAKMPKTAQDALVRNIAGMPMLLPSLALADVIRRIQVPQIQQPMGFMYQPGGGLTLPNPSIFNDPLPPPPPSSGGASNSFFNGIDWTTPLPKKKRAFGGPVGANRMYMVGERGPELFMSGSTGRVIPNNELGGASVTVGTINVNGENAREVADQIAGELLTAMYRKSRAEVLTS